MIRQVLQEGSTMRELNRSLARAAGAYLFRSLSRPRQGGPEHRFAASSFGSCAADTGSFQNAA